MNLIDPNGLQTAGSPEEFPSDGYGKIYLNWPPWEPEPFSGDASPISCTPIVVVQGPIATLPVVPAPMISSPSWAIQAGNNRLNTSAIPGGPAGAPNTSSSFGGGGSFRGGGGGGGGVSAAGNKGNSSGTAPATNAASMVANYAAGASASAQLWMSDLAKGFNTNSNTFTRFNSIYNNLGIARKTFGRLGIAASAISIGFNYHAMQNWNLSPERFAYRTSGTLISILGAAYIGGQVGGPWGAIGGAGISTMFLLGESAYDAGSIFWNKVTDVTNRFYNDFSSQPWSIYGY